MFLILMLWQMSTFDEVDYRMSTFGELTCKKILLMKLTANRFWCYYNFDVVEFYIPTPSHSIVIQDLFLKKPT
jgi:hypothetical protein